MRIHPVLGASGFVLGAAASLWAFCPASPAPLPWGSDGHRMATRAAHEILPDAMPPFFRDARDHLEYLGPEPDRWRSAERREMDEAWKYDHYIDLENVPPGALQAPDRFAFFTTLVEVGIARPQERVGFLPFRILELYQRLVTGFAEWRVKSSGPDRRWIEARILNDAGILGHYVVDAAQPHHTTIHFNGWAEGVPNPKGFTTDRGFHSRFETGFVRAHLAYDELPPLLPSGPRRLTKVRAAIWEHVQSSHATVERLYELERLYGFDPEAPAHPETRDFALQRLASGAGMLAAIWWTAWLESEALARSVRERGWRP